MIKGSIQQGDITIINIYVPNKGRPKYIKTTVMRAKGADKLQYGNCWRL